MTQRMSNPPRDDDSPIFDETDALYLSALINCIIETSTPLELSTSEALTLFHILARTKQALWQKHGEDLLPYLESWFLDDESHLTDTSEGQNDSELEDQLALPF